MMNYWKLYGKHIGKIKLGAFVCKGGGYGICIQVGTLFQGYNHDHKYKWKC
jgi:hypothetical protein